MSTTQKSRAGIISAFGYLAWFALLVRLLYLATTDQPSGFAEALGVHLGVGLSLLALLGIPYFILKLHAKRHDKPMSWLLVMMWTTIIALLLAVGGFYGRSKINLPTSSPTNFSAYSSDFEDRKNLVPPESVGRYLSRLDEGVFFDIPIGYQILDNPTGNKPKSADDLVFSNAPVPKSTEAFDEIWSIASREDGKIFALRAGSKLAPARLTRQISDQYSVNLKEFYLRRNCSAQPVTGNLERLQLNCGPFVILLGETDVDQSTGENRVFLEVKRPL